MASLYAPWLVIANYKPKKTTIALFITISKSIFKSLSLDTNCPRLIFCFSLPKYRYTTTTVSTKPTLVHRRRHFIKSVSLFFAPLKHTLWCVGVLELNAFPNYVIHVRKDLTTHVSLHWNWNQSGDGLKTRRRGSVAIHKFFILVFLQ